ncbi:hypothetical protein Taro_030189 [Colocasia esculenta]|uniref:Uncharacterized protein n=1 Tax=Colocasia esculenta TaxID=4460 RepID=A0A843VVE6_COLES|nr:hypothetical protein [Colocasia esculenta]
MEFVERLVSCASGDPSDQLIKCTQSGISAISKSERVTFSIVPRSGSLPFQYQGRFGLRPPGFPTRWPPPPPPWPPGAATGNFTAREKHASDPSTLSPASTRARRGLRLGDYISQAAVPSNMENKRIPPDKTFFEREIQVSRDFVPDSTNRRLQLNPALPNPMRLAGEEKKQKGRAKDSKQGGGIMCIAAWVWQGHPLYPFLLVLNRDEPTKPVGWWGDGSQKILGGRDGVAGGTWLGCTRTGRLAFLTNVLEPDNIPTAKSRGDLPVKFLECGKSPLDFAEEVANEADKYNGFNLILADLCSKTMVYVSNRPNGEPVSIVLVTPGLHVLTNAGLDTPWHKPYPPSSLFLFKETILFMENLHFKTDISILHPLFTFPRAAAT